MSTKFEQLLDLIVNEDKQKAEELFHAIVVEKSREIYENLIAEEAEEENTDMEEAEESDEDPVEEGADDVEESDDTDVEESMDLEDSYSMEADDEDPMSSSGDATDEFGSDIGGDEMGGEEDPESQEDSAIMDIKTAIQELEAAFAELEQAQGGEASHGGFGSEEEPEMGMDDEDEGMMMGKPAFEGRRITREYTEKVGNDWDKSGSQKGQGQYVGSGSGDKEGAPVEGRSPVSSGKGKPTTGATAGNILKHTADGTSNTGTSPTGKAGGFLSAAKDMGTGNGNVPGGKMGVKNLSAVKGGHGAEKKGSGPGPVGSGTGDKAGQTSVGQAKSPLNGAPNRNA
jgi:hypothetical protein